MRVQSLSLGYQGVITTKTKKLNKKEKLNNTQISIPTIKPTNGIMISFTGEKNINQLASNCAENKRIGNSVGGMGVVTKEASDSWRLKEGMDVRDFSPYHSYDNQDGGLKVVIIKKDKNGKIITAYSTQDFYHAKADDTIDSLQKREKIKLKEGEKLAFVYQHVPNSNGISDVIILKDTNIKGTVERASTSSITQTEYIPYRLFVAESISDPVTDAIEKFKKGILDSIKKPYLEKYTEEIKNKYEEALKLAKQKDNANFEEILNKYDTKIKELKTDNINQTKKFVTENKEYFKELNLRKKYTSEDIINIINNRLDTGEDDLNTQTKLAQIKKELEKVSISTNTERLLKQKQKETKSKTNEEKVIAKINKEIQEAINSNTEIQKENLKYLETPEVKAKMDQITSTAAKPVNERNAAYFIHTPGLARFEAPYGSSSAYYTTSAKVMVDGQLKDVSTNLSYADSNRAFVDILPQLNTQEHGFYNPANIWLHDRPSFMVMNYIADESNFGTDYYNGLRIDSRFHNPGRDYQGAESNPFEFFRMVARKEDVKALNKHPQIEKIKEFESKYSKVWTDENAVPLEVRRFIYKVFDPFLKNFQDDFIDTARVVRTYNISMTPVASVKENPKNMTCGTVSMNYGQEMKSLDTPDIAQYMTRPLALINTIDITNGSTPANLRLDDPNADFCRKGHINGITKAKAGFTTYKYIPIYDKNGKLISDNIEEILKAKKANTKWFLNILGEAFANNGIDGLNQMFFSSQQIAEGAEVIGNLSKYQEGDMLFMGWGRPDPQKGYPATFQSFLDFLKNPNVDKEVKKHAKLVVGAGVWDKNAKDYKWVKDIIRQIEELDNGAYKGQACYVNGFFPNRLVACATFSIFSSRYEPCGITPLESFAAGTPVISTGTGGAVDFVKATRGYITKHPFLRNPKDLNIDPNELKDKNGQEVGDIIDNARTKANAEELSECMKDAIDTTKKKDASYSNMVKDCFQQKIDWHENADYNGDKPANRRYMEEVFGIQTDTKTRFQGKLERLVGDHFGIAETIKDGSQKVRNKWSKALIGATIAIGALCTAGYVFMKKRNKTTSPTEEKTKELNKVA